MTENDWKLINGIWQKHTAVYDTEPIKSKVVIKGFQPEGKT